MRNLFMANGVSCGRPLPCHSSKTYLYKLLVQNLLLLIVGLIFCVSARADFAFNGSAGMNNFVFAGDAQAVSVAPPYTDGPDVAARISPRDYAGRHTKGAMYYWNKQSVAHGFYISFQFRISNSDTTYQGADGIAFVIHNDAKQTSALGAAGGAMGYGGDSQNTGISHSLAVEFDTFQNPEYGDFNNSHISVHTRGAAPNSANEQYAISRMSYLPQLKDGALHTAQITYTADNHVLSVYLDETKVLSKIINIADTLNLSDGKAYVGFTSATASGSADHDIYSSRFIETPSGGGGNGGVSPKRKVILIRGTGNNSTYEHNLLERLYAAGYSKSDILTTDLWNHEGSGPNPTWAIPLSDAPVLAPIAPGANTIEESVNYIRRRIIERQQNDIVNNENEVLKKWGAGPTEVDIIAHSAGGLAARYLINKGNGDRLIKVKNCITLGTPYGGIDGAKYAVAQLAVGGPLAAQYAGRTPQGNLNYLPWSKITRPRFENSSLGGMVGDYQTDFSEYNGVMYWGIGGTVSENTLDTHELYGSPGAIPLQYRLAGPTELRLNDGFINTYSAIGQAPRRNDYSEPQPRFRFLPVSHGTLPSNVTGCENSVGLMLQVLLDQVNPAEGWPEADCGTTNMARFFSAMAMNSTPQLIEARDVLLETGVPQTAAFPVDSGQKLALSIMTQDVVSVRIVKPDGSDLDVAGGDPTVTYESYSEEGITSRIVTVTQPPVGQWQVVYTLPLGHETSAVGSLYATIENELALSANSDKKEYENGARPILTAVLIENGAPLTGATVRAALLKKGRLPITVTLLDDGAHNDGAANDGVYGGSPAALTSGGIYDIGFLATGNTTSNEAFQRIAFDFFTVAPESATLSKTYTDEGVDTDEDDVFEYLQANAGVNVVEAGDYLVEADLKDGEGNLIASALGTAKNLQPGQRTVAILFDGQTILQHGKPGPYKVDNVRLYADTQERPVWIETDADGYTTQAYTLAQFDHPPAVIVLQPDETNPVADSSFGIIVQATDEDTPATFDVYYDTDADGSDGTLIAENLPADGEHVVTWDTSAIPEGAYYIYAVASDGIRPAVTSYSRGTVQVQHGGGEPAVNQPDLLIKTDEQGDSSYGINNEYQTIPEGEQVESLTVPNGQVQIFQVKVENDGTSARSFVIKAQENQAAGYTTAYAVGATNITTAIRSAGYTTASLEPGEFIVIEVAVTASGVAPGTEKTILVEAFRDGDDTTVRDAVAILKEAVLPPQNTPPVLNAIGDVNVDEETPITFQVNASDADVPAQELTFSATGLPAGADFDAVTRMFSWTPGEAQGLGSYQVTFSVSDGQAQDYETVTITVAEVNTAPVLDPIGNKTAKPGSKLTFTATAADADIPAQTLTYSLVGAPAGATIHPATGAFSWTPPTPPKNGGRKNLLDLLEKLLRALFGLPPDTQSHTFKVRVSDGAASDEEEIAIVVGQGNAVPVLKSIGNEQVNENTTLDFTIEASDADTPAKLLVYSASGLPAGASFNASTRRFSWRPTEAQGPGTYQVTFTVSDGMSQDSETVAIIVREVNFAPVLLKIGDKTVKAGKTLTFTARAMDADVPVQVLSYSLEGAPAGAAINPITGVFTWTSPSQSGSGGSSNKSKNLRDWLEELLRARAGRSYTFTVKVSDGVTIDKERIMVKVN